MQFNNNSRQQALDTFNNLSANHQDQMRLSSVRLTNGGFTGSGVLVRDADNVIGIITAKHNLCVNADINTPTVWNETDTIDLINQFLTDLVVGYNAQQVGLSPGNTENLNSVNSDIEFHSGFGSWDYDLMFISFKTDLAIRSWVNEQVGRCIDYTRNGTELYQQSQENRTVFTTGFGDMLTHQGNQPNFNHFLQVRSANITNSARQVLRHQNPNTNFHSVISATASNNTSTAPGDSGGPMFCVYQNNVYLLGVTLGSNFAHNEIINDNPIVSNEVTYLYNQGELF